MKKPAPTYRAGDDELFSLFDTFQLDRVRDLLHEMADPTPKSEREGMADALRRLLGVPVNNLKRRILDERGARASELDAVTRFAEAVEAVAVDLESASPLDATAARDLATTLRAAWLEFIAYAGAFRMYHDLPRELEHNRTKTKVIREKRAALAYAQRVDHDLVVAEYAKLKAQGARGLRAAVAAQFGIKAQTVANIWADRDRTLYP